MSWFFDPIRRYARFGGRTSRREFWPFMMCAIVASICTGLVLPPLGVLAALVMSLPCTAAAVRRVHDLDLSGRWLLPLLVLPALMLIVLVGANSLFTLILTAAIDPTISDSDVNNAATTMMTFLGWLLAGCLIFAAVALAWRGSPAPNRFGAARTMARP